MARTKSIKSRQKLKELIPNKELHAIALETGLVKRVRNFNLDAFVWTLVFCFGLGDGRTLAGLHQIYLSVALSSMARSSFHKWMTKKELSKFFQAILVNVFDRMSKGVTKELSGVLGQFRELFSIDSTVIRLHDCLQNIFPGNRTNHSPAALKLHVVQKVGGGGVKSVKVTDGKTADLNAFRIGPWVKGALFLMDLGYYAFRKFARINESGGYFISRVKAGANPKILGSLATHRGRKVEVEGRSLKDILPRLRRKIIDIEVVVKFDRRTYGGNKARRDQQALRLVGIWNTQEKRHHLYFTNLAPEQLSAEAISEAYRQRWQIELLFRELKGVQRLNKVPGANPHTAIAMMFSSILSLMASRTLISAIRQALRLEEADIPFERGARVIQRLSGNLLRLVVLAPRNVGRLHIDIERVLLSEAPDPNKKRPILLRNRTNLMATPAPETMM